MLAFSCRVMRRGKVGKEEREKRRNREEEGGSETSSFQQQQAVMLAPLSVEVQSYISRGLKIISRLCSDRKMLKTYPLLLVAAKFCYLRWPFS